MQKDYNYLNDFTVFSFNKGIQRGCGRLRILMEIGAPQVILDNEIKLIEMKTRELDRKLVRLN